MKLKNRLFGLTAVLTVAATVFTASPAMAATIETGHLDVFDVDYNAADNTLTLDLKTYAPDNDDLSPAGQVLRVTPAATATIPSGTAWQCLGPAGTTMYVAPQTLVSDRLYAGWNTTDVPAAQGPVKLELTGWSGPAGSRFALYTTGGFPATPSFKLNTNTAAGCPVSVWPGGIAAGTHAHGNWAFSTAGTYTLTFRATAQNGAGATSGAVTYTFQAG
ncbi:choice-of-anchor M domain-containing protein [Micromonospora sp. NBC_01796]|uniref:choice-of-anchor M domain-containing protein n=1 Tax=Micromonospora sp. NBC_01796 TaxID=2975987 RepID=UPI002DDA71CC|nr:choice-of-anchor M domain-containing protein [Micromonospora sp. NBC_01796]WSA82829.1 choice-of-anchor M domain-containing protein [Micromonospora sp. NBC_01796]